MSKQYNRSNVSCETNESVSPRSIYIVLVSYAEYHSNGTPVERVYAKENRALSRYGPFIIDTKLIKVGSKEHMDGMK